MGRKLGGKNKPKSESSNGLGHNSGEAAPLSAAELTDDQKQVIWFGSKRRIVALKESIASITVELRQEYKKLKADFSLTKADIDFALSLDDEDAEEKHRRRMMLARWEQHPIGLQADLFGDGVDRTPAVDKKRAEGKRHGLAGEPCNPDCDASSPQYQHYMVGFHEGQAVLAQGIKRPDQAAGGLAAEAAAERARLVEWKKGRQLADEMMEPVGTESATAGPGE